MKTTFFIFLFQPSPSSEDGLDQAINLFLLPLKHHEFYNVYQICLPLREDLDLVRFKNLILFPCGRSGSFRPVFCFFVCFGALFWCRWDFVLLLEYVQSFFLSIVILSQDEELSLCCRQPCFLGAIIPAFVHVRCRGDRVIFVVTCSSLGLRGSVSILGMSRPFGCWKSLAHPLSGLMGPVELILVTGVCFFRTVALTVFSAGFGMHFTGPALVAEGISSELTVMWWSFWFMTRWLKLLVGLFCFGPGFSVPTLLFVFVPIVLFLVVGHDPLCLLNLFWIGACLYD